MKINWKVGDRAICGDGMHALVVWIKRVNKNQTARVRFWGMRVAQQEIQLEVTVKLADLTK